MKNKILILILIVTIVTPQVASAAWWNPFSWLGSRENFSKIEPQTTTTEEGTKNSPKIDEFINIQEEKNKIQEKIIEKIITVDNPELQKKINTLIQENTTLQSKVASLAASLNSCKASGAAGISSTTRNNETGYSDFDFKYSYNNNVITLLHSTSRELAIKKAVFYLDREYSEIFMKELDKAGTTSILQVGSGSYKLERNGRTFLYIGKAIPITGSEIISVVVTGVSGVKFEGIAPVWQDWEIWDYTSGKPVLVN